MLKNGTKGILNMKIIESTQIQILKNRINALERQNDNLRKKNESLESQVEIYKSSNNDINKVAVSAKAFSEVENAKKEYEKLNAELREKLKEANTLIKNCKILLNKEGVKLTQTINKEVSKFSK